MLKKKTVLTVVFLLSASALNLLFFGRVEQLRADDRLLGGPAATIVDESGYLVLKDATLVSNSPIVIISPSVANATVADPHFYQVANTLPDLGGYFSIPTSGWNWGHLHSYNAVDIANACGTPIYAAAEGTVAESNDGSWNDGYGSYIVINHPNNVSTKYSHNKKNFVSIGQYILRGDLIAYIGNTGNTHGPTGCHLHFEVRGAKNPFAKK